MNLTYHAAAGKPVLTEWLIEVEDHAPSRAIVQTLIDDGWVVIVNAPGQLTLAAPSNQLWCVTPSDETWPNPAHHRLTFLRLTVFMGRLGSQFISEGSVPWAAPVPFRSISYSALLDLLLTS